MWSSLSLSNLSREKRYQEKNRRLIHIIPNTKMEKVHTAMSLVGNRTGLLPEEYANNIVSNSDKELVRGYISLIIDKLIDLSKLLGPKESCVKTAIAYGIHRGRDIGEWGMTIMDRTMRYLAIITKINMDSRCKIIDTQTGKFYPISTVGDLKETLELMGHASSLLRPYIIDWANLVFYPAFKDLPSEPNRTAKESFDSQGNTREVTVMQERTIGLTTRQLADKTEEITGNAISAETILKSYLYPLQNAGIIDAIKSVIDNRQYLYSPVEDNLFSMFENGEDLRLSVKPELYPSKRLLEESFRIIIESSCNDEVKSEKMEMVIGDTNL
jgi:hypothetical protein